MTFPIGMIGSGRRRKKRYGIEQKPAGGGGGAGDSAAGANGGAGNEGDLQRFDFEAYQGAQLTIKRGQPGEGGRHGLRGDEVNAALAAGGDGWRKGGDGGDCTGGPTPRGKGGAGAGSTAVVLDGQPLAVAGGGPGGSAAVMDQPGTGGGTGTTAVTADSSGNGATGRSGAVDETDGAEGGGGGGGGGVDGILRGGDGGQTSRHYVGPNRPGGGGRKGASYLDTARTLTYTGPVSDLSAYGQGGPGGIGGGTAATVRGQSGGPSIVRLRDYETGQTYDLPDGPFTLP